MQKNRSRFIILDLAVPCGGDAAFRRGLELSGARIVSAARHRYVITAPDALSLWKFLDTYLGPCATDGEVDALIAAHVRRRGSPPTGRARSASAGSARPGPSWARGPTSR